MLKPGCCRQTYPASYSSMRCDIEECSSANHGWATVLWALVLVSLAYAGRCMRHRSLASPSQVSLRRHTVMSASLLLVGAGLATSIGAHLAAPTGTCGVVCHEYLFDAHAEEYYGVQSAERPLPSLSFSAGRWPQNWHPTPLVNWGAGHTRRRLSRKLWRRLWLSLMAPMLCSRRVRAPLLTSPHRTQCLPARARLLRLQTLATRSVAVYPAWRLWHQRGHWAPSCCAAAGPGLEAAASNQHQIDN